MLSIFFSFKYKSKQNSAVAHRFWHREDNGCCWLLEVPETTRPEWTFYLAQPVEGWFGRYLLYSLPGTFKTHGQWIYLNKTYSCVASPTLRRPVCWYGVSRQWVKIWSSFRFQMSSTWPLRKENEFGRHASFSLYRWNSITYPSKM